MKKTHRYFFFKGQKGLLNKLESWSEKPLLEKKIGDRPDNSKFLKVTNNDEKISIVLCEALPFVTFDKAFIKTKAVSFVTYFKDSKKIYEKDGSECFREFFSHPSAVKYLGLDFLSGGGYKMLHSKFVIRGVFTGKITNKMDAFKLLMKTSYKIDTNTIPLKATYRFFITGIYGGGRNREVSFSKILQTSQSFQSTLLNIERLEEYGDISDLVEMAYKLGRKINYNVSCNKLGKIHDDLSKEVRMLKREYGVSKNRKISYKTRPPSTNQITVLTSSFEFENEGDELRHCVASAGYFHAASVKDIFVLSCVDDDKYRFTVAVGVKARALVIEQMRGKRNETVPNYGEAHDMVNEFVQTKLFEFSLAEGIISSESKPQKEKLLR